VVIVVAVSLAFVLASVGDDFIEQFQDEQDDERAQKRRY
jgi:hypothetical protein